VARELRWAVQQGARIVTTNLVIAETHALLLRRLHCGAARAFLREVRQAPHIVVTSTPEHEKSAEQDWLDRFQDQDLSLTDAVSFAVMTERGIGQALTLDRHFAAARVAMLPGEKPSGLDR
jgi:predicted nucleic acid-binding protein